MYSNGCRSVVCPLLSERFRKTYRLRGFEYYQNLLLIQLLNLKRILLTLPYSSTSFPQSAQLVQRRELICVTVYTLVCVTLYALIYAAVYTQVCVCAYTLVYVSIYTLVYVSVYTLFARGALRSLIARNEISQTAVQIFVR